jgi:hypothetical protein
VLLLVPRPQCVVSLASVVTLRVLICIADNIFTDICLSNLVYFSVNL